MIEDREELPRDEFNLPPGVSSRDIEDAQETDTPAPGPYRADAWTVLDRDGNLIAEVYSDASGDQAEATVRLLAAAWEMRDLLAHIGGILDFELEERVAVYKLPIRNKLRNLLRRVEGSE